VGGARLRALIAFHLAGGHRRGEARHLRWREHALRLDGGGWEIAVHGFTKTGAHHTTLLAGVPAAALDAWAAEHAARWPASPWVFPVQKDVRHRGRVLVAAGEQVRSAYVLSDDVWRRFKSAMGLPETFRPHDLRGSYAKELLRAGVPAAVVSQAMGHRSRETLATYARAVRSESAEQVAAVMAAAAGRGKDAVP
jgi:integrase